MAELANNSQQSVLYELNGRPVKKERQTVMREGGKSKFFGAPQTVFD